MFLAYVPSAHADSVSINNSVSVSSNNGAATAEVTTILNGEVVTDIKESGEHVSIETTNSFTDIDTTNISVDDSPADTVEMVLLLETLLELLLEQYALLTS
jgi:hypothetical protein